jgi:predicted RNase H-like HicB family nuclease
MRYTVIIDGKKGSYGVVVPDLPGCTAMSATIEEALANVIAAMRDWVEIAGEAGTAIPAPAEPEVLRHDPEVREAGDNAKRDVCAFISETAPLFPLANLDMLKLTLKKSNGD